MIRRLGKLVAAALLLVAPFIAKAADRPPLVLAAASLQESLSAAADAWAAKGHVRPVLSFAASSALARQIGAGAAADLFISADVDWMNHVEKQGMILSRSRAAFLSNRLVLVAPAASPAKVAIRKGFPLARLLGQARLAMADPEAVPAGKYGKAALESLGVWKAVEPKVARAENVRAALALVERGAAPFGIVYETDARASADVRIVGMFPPASHPPVVYPMALLKTTGSPDAESFRRFLLSPPGHAIFARYGFRSTR